MSRKQVFANLIKTEADQPNSSRTDGHTVVPPAPVRPLLETPSLLAVGGGSPVGLLAKSLNELKDRSKHAEEIELQLKSGEVIIKLDPSTIEPSIVPDRMASSTKKLDSLVASMRENGQEVPILVRPHPDKPSKYQIAYGWRRTQAALILGIQVDAIVRQLTDEELIRAQGQENSERKNLSYIEKALWVHQLSRRFTREFVMSTLSIYKSDLSNMLSVVEKIPEDLIAAIEEAQEAGRRQWMLLADRLSSPTEIEAARSIASGEGFGMLSSEERLKTIVDALKPASYSSEKEALFSPTGDKIGQIIRSKRKITITVDRKASPTFADYLTRQLQTFVQEYREDEHE
ncbi:ParB family chromosome partitioning protein [Aquamicrobium terrae]